MWTSKKLALIVVFAALTIVLNPVRIPTLYWPGFFYRLWEIPIVIAFLLFGFKISIAVGVLNVLAQIILFPLPAGVLAYPWGFVAVFVMLLGLQIGKKIIKKNQIIRKTLLVLTFFGVLLRVIIMPFVDFVVYNSLLPIALGRTFTMTYIFSLIPGIIAFNIIVPFYTIPTAYLVSKKISQNLNFNQHFTQ
jgi:riboflavin transporter FmnP